ELLNLLVPLRRIDSGSLCNDFVPWPALLPRVASRASRNDVPPRMKAKIGLIERNQVIFDRLMPRSELDPAVATPLAEELSDGGEVLRLHVLGQSTHLVVRCAEVLQEDPRRSICDVRPRLQSH